MATVMVCTLEMGEIRAEQRDWALALLKDGRHDLVFRRARAKPTSSNRNEVALFVRSDPEVDYLLTVDDDVVPPVRVLDYVEEDRDVVVFPYHIWRANENADHPVMLAISLLEDARTRWVDKRQRLVEISRGGTGAMLIARRVLEHPAMAAPFADGFDDAGVRNNGHDLMFCDRARAAGFTIWAAMDCVSSHYKTVDLARVSQLLARQRAYATSFVSPREALEGKRVVFSLSPGRCGTRWLALALQTVEGVVARHEPGPNFADVMRTAQEKTSLAYQFWLERKLPAMLAELRSAGSRVYVETSHLFGQGFVEPLLDVGVVPDAIVLRRGGGLDRHLRDVALSYWRRGSVPGRTAPGRTWLLAPAAGARNGNGGPPKYMAPEAWTDYQCCYWFAVEMEYRSRLYAERLRQCGARVHETTLEELTERQGFARLVEALQLGDVAWGAYEEMAQRKVNATPDARRAAMPDGDLEAQEVEVEVMYDGW
jgi:hypothetical protein